MITWLISFLFIMNMVFANEGKVSKIVGDQSAYLIRNMQNIVLREELEIEIGDEIISMNSVVLIYLRPTTQIGLSKNSRIKITQNLIEDNLEKEKTTSVIEFIKGIIRLQVTRDDELEINQKVVADGVSFAVRGTEFEVSKDGEDFELDVVEGEVEVASPYVQTFVPEIVKANQGFQFNKKSRSFRKRKFRTKFSDHPKFTGKMDILKRWKEKRTKNSNKVRKKLKSQRKRRSKR